MNFTDPIRDALGVYLQGFKRELIGDTPAVREFIARDFSKSVVRAPGRMIDQVNKIVAAWRENDTSRETQMKAPLPLLVVAMAKDYLPSQPEFGRITGDPQWVMIPNDPKERLFRLKIVGAEIRTQIVILAADEPTARSLAMQLNAYIDQLHNRRFASIYPLAGINQKWPVMLENPSIIAVSTPTDPEQKNVTILAGDVTLRATIPMLLVPKSTELNDGKGAGANQDRPFDPDYDPSGYLCVVQADGTNYPPPGAPNTQPPAMGEWSVEVEE